MDWKLTQTAIGAPEIDVIHDDGEEDLALGWALLHALAEAEGSAQRLAPGVVWYPKSSPEKML